MAGAIWAGPAASPLAATSPGTHLAEVGERVVRHAVVEHAGLGLGGARQLDAVAVGRRASRGRRRPQGVGRRARRAAASARSWRRRPRGRGTGAAAGGRRRPAGWRDRRRPRPAGRRWARTATARRRCRAGAARPSAARRRPSSGPPPRRRPGPGRRRRPARRRPCRHEKSPDAGEVLSPCPRKSSAQQWATAASSCAIGAQVIARKPVGWHISRGGPSPPRSWSATVTPSVDGTVRAGGEGAIRPCWQRGPTAGPCRTRPAGDRGPPAAGRVGDRCRTRGHRGRAAANRRYYDAFEARDLDAMSDVWHHGDEVVVHPSRVEDAARVGGGGRVVVRPVRRPAAPAVHPHRRAGPGSRARRPG